jgi:hypothetical protein
VPQVLVSGATIQCTHGGVARLSGGDSRLTVSDNGAITSGMEVGISFAPASPTVITPCNFKLPNGTPSPCSATVAATAGISTMLAVGGTPVLLDTASGVATNTPPANWKVAGPGQTILSSAS